MGLDVLIKNGVGWVDFDFPPINLFTSAIVRQLSALADDMAANDSVAVVVFQSANDDFFVPHFDINDVNEAPQDPGQSDNRLNFFQAMIEKWRVSPKISIGKVAGICRGAGSEFILGLDMCYADRDRAVFSLPETLFGFPPGGGSCQYLARRIGIGRALELILSGEDYDATQVASWGMITRALPGKELDRFVMQLAEQIGAMPLASVAHTKNVVSLHLPLDQALVEGNAEWNRLRQRPEIQAVSSRKVAAFLAAGGQDAQMERNFSAIRSAMAAA